MLYFVFTFRKETEHSIIYSVDNYENEEIPDNVTIHFNNSKRSFVGRYKLIKDESSSSVNNGNGNGNDNGNGNGNDNGNDNENDNGNESKDSGTKKSKMVSIVY